MKLVSDTVKYVKDGISETFFTIETFENKYMWHLKYQDKIAAVIVSTKSYPTARACSNIGGVGDATASRSHHLVSV